MNTKIKEVYLPPQSEALELRLEGVIAHSYVDPFGDTEKW